MTSLSALSAPRLTLDRRAILRGMAAGSAWGIAVSTALLGLSFYQCGTICFGQIIDTTALSVAAGVFTIGSIAVFGPEARTSAQ